jgi:hypothetical protein
VYGVDDWSVVMTGRLNPRGATAHWFFEIGTARAYSDREPHVGSEEPLSGREFEPVEEAMNCLAPDTRYHSRLVAVDGTGKTYGNDRTFKTKPWQSRSRKVAYRRCPAGKPMK